MPLRPTLQSVALPQTRGCAVAFVMRAMCAHTCACESAVCSAQSRGHIQVTHRYIVLFLIPLVSYCIILGAVLYHVGRAGRGCDKSDAIWYPKDIRIASGDGYSGGDMQSVSSAGSPPGTSVSKVW